MNFLQISAPKSGSYWLYTILSQILQKKGLPLKSFIQKQPIYQKAKTLDLSFKGQAGVDMMDIEEDACYYRISSVFREEIKDLEKYTRSSSITWTHSTCCSTSFKVFPLFDKKICIIRDPRDRALSSAKFAFTPYMQKHYPSSHSSPEEYLDKELERLLEQWVWFVGQYLFHKESLDIHLVFYERLLYSFKNEFQALLDYLEIDLSPEDQHKIAKAVAFSTMKEKSPRHLEKGKYGKWVHQLDQAQKETALRKAGGLLKILGYPLDSEQVLPSTPKRIPREELKFMLEQIEWQELFV